MTPPHRPLLAVGVLTAIFGVLVACIIADPSWPTIAIASGLAWLSMLVVATLFTE